MRRPECLDQSEGEGERQEVVQGRDVDFIEKTLDLPKHLVQG